jgi:hypothetical protein
LALSLRPQQPLAGFESLAEMVRSLKRSYPHAVDVETPSETTMMGEAKRALTATQKFIQQFPECCFCGGVQPATTREHMPQKSLFNGSHRPDKLVMPACGKCNGATSTADLAVSLISRWGDQGTPQERVDHARLAARLRRQAPELADEWTTNLDIDETNGARQHLINHGVPVPVDAEIATVGPLTIRHLNLFSHKAVLALYFEHFRRPLTDQGRVCAFWRTKEDFARDGIPPIFFEMLPSYGTLTQGRWSAQKIFEYRHAESIEEGVFGCLARFRQGFFVYGFAVADSVRLPRIQDDWITPSELLAIFNAERDHGQTNF